MPWGTQGSSETLDGASGRTWTLTFERRLAPRKTSDVVNPASTVWLVRDQNSARLYAAKRQTLVSLNEVEALVDEASAWRSACLASTQNHVVELEDVFVFREPPLSVIFLAEFCSRGLLPKRPPMSESALLTIIADLAKAASTLPSPHAHIAYDSLLVDQNGRIRLSGFGAHRSAILRDNPGLAPSDDSFDIGLLAYELVFGVQPPESLLIPDNSPYSPRLTQLISLAFSHPHPTQLFDRAVAAGAHPLVPVVTEQKEAGSLPTVPQHVEKATERNVDNLVDGVDIAASFSSLLQDLNQDLNGVSQQVFKALHKKPIREDPLCALRLLTMLHNLILDGPEMLLAVVRKNDKFMEWVETSWTRETIEASPAKEKKPTILSFAAGDLAFYSALLRRKAKFHLLVVGGFTGRWERTGATSSDDRDVISMRRRKVISGMADVIEMASELGCRFAIANDPEASVKHAALGALISECCLAYNAAEELAREVQTIEGCLKVQKGLERVYVAARTLVFAVEHVPSAGGEDWVEQFASDSPPNIKAEIEARELGKQKSLEEQSRLRDDDEQQKKRERKEERQRRREEKERKRAELVSGVQQKEQESENTADEKALVIHGADDASKALTTMFGDLLSLDPQVPEAEGSPPPDLHMLPEMTNAQALASAFGVPEDSVDLQQALPPISEESPDYDDDEGAYNDYQAKQKQRQQQGVSSRQGSMTAKWAAKSGYTNRSLVVTDGTNGQKKKHPVFCQCALCIQEEEQAAAEQIQSSKHVSDVRTDAHNFSEFRSSDISLNDKSKDRMQSRSHYYQNAADSLDDEEETGYGLSNKPESKEQPGNNDSYYRDDYDSYESLSYNIEEDAAAAVEPSNPPHPTFVLRPPHVTSAHEMSQASQNRPFTVDKKLALNMKKLRLGDKISETPSILVYKGEYNRESVAVKKLSKKGLQSHAAIEEFSNEVKIMCSLSHPRLISCIAAILQRPNYVFVTEFMKRGTLFDLLHKQRIKLTLALVRRISLQLAEGMAYLHQSGFVHRDLKSLNVFVDGSFNIKIGDFGLAQDGKENKDTGVSGTYQYMAPEVLRGEPHSQKSDVYSFAVLLCEMVSGQSPFQGIEARQVAERVLQENIRPTIPMNCQRGYVELIQMCWGASQSTRPTFSKILELLNSTSK